MNTFTPVSLTERDRYLTLLHAAAQHSIDYTFANIWGWQRPYGLHWCFEENLCWLRQECDTPCFWAPIGDWSATDFAQHPLLRGGATLIRVPELLTHMLISALPDRAVAQEDRNHWEYLYATQDLATLPGNRYHKKRNHANSFRKSYSNREYRLINALVMEDVLALEDEWCQWHECAGSPALQAENEAINRVLSHWDTIPGLVGGALYVEHILVAFSVGEPLDQDTLGVHYEKARNGYRGVYQAMNMEFALKAASGYTHINRAQDLGEEGLRQAKSSYLPVDFLRKYTVNIAPE